MRYSSKRQLVSWLKRILPLAVPLVVASCADTFAPSTPPERPAEPDAFVLGQPTGERVSAGELRVLSHNLQLTSADGVPLIVKRNTAPSAAPPLDTYEIEFWVVQGVGRTVEVNYQDDGEHTEPFLRFTVPANGLALRPDGSTIHTGDSVLITLQIDASSVHTHFAPSGLTFNEDAPAELKIWYTGFLDASKIENPETLPDFWYGEDAAAEEWFRLYTAHDTNDCWIKTHVHHFSDFAISW